MKTDINDITMNIRQIEESTQDALHEGIALTAISLSTRRDQFRRQEVAPNVSGQTTANAFQIVHY